MLHVVPSEVVKAIDAAFPDPLDARLTPYNSHVVAGVVALAHRVPDAHLANRSADERRLFIQAIAICDDLLKAWATVEREQGMLGATPKGPMVVRLQSLGDRNPIEVIRSVLAQCSDDAPVVTVPEPRFLGDSALAEVLSRAAGEGRSVDSAEPVRIFVSHSSADKSLAQAVVALLRSALGLPPPAIRCTSLDGYRFAAGADTDEQIRREVLAADVVLGLISPASLDSLYVAFELGARWGADKPIFPLAAPGVDLSTIRGPLGGKNTLRADSPGELHQLIADVGRELGITPHSAASYQADIEEVLSQPTVQQSVAAPDVASRVPEGYIVAHGITWDVRDGRWDAYCEGCRTGANRMVNLSASPIGMAQLYTCPHGHPRIRVGIQQFLNMRRCFGRDLRAGGAAGHGNNVEGDVKIVRNDPRGGRSADQS